MKPSFRVYFNRRKQYVEVYIAKDAKRYVKETGLYGEYTWSLERNSKRGKFGEIHLSNTGSALHEITHLWFDIIRERDYKINNLTEERLVRLLDDLHTRFWREYFKWKKKHK